MLKKSLMGATALTAAGVLSASALKAIDGNPGVYAEPAPQNQDLSGVTEIKDLVNKLGRDFEQFRAANDARIAEVEQFGNETPEMRAKIEKADKDIAALQAALDETVGNIGRLTVGGGSLAGGDDIAALRANAELFFCGVNNQPSVDITEERLGEYRDYCNAFEKFLRYSQDSRAMQDPAIRAAMSVGSNPDGGYFVPQEISQRIIQRIFDTSPMRQVASVISITGDSIKFPNDVNDATSGGWVGETDARGDTATPQVGEQEIFVREQFAQPKVTQKLLDMASMDVESWLNGKIASKMSRTENTAFVSGTGTASPRGFLNYSAAAVTTADSARAWGKLQYTPSGAAGGFPAYSGTTADDPSALIDMIAALKPEYRANARWMMNRTSEASVRKLRDADGRYLVGMGDLREGVAGFILHGYPIVNAEDMPAIGSDTFPIAFGDWAEGYLIVDGIGIRILRDPYTAKPYVKFYTTKSTGGDVLNFDAIKLMKMATS